jgi:hypothetical protein
VLTLKINFEASKEIGFSAIKALTDLSRTDQLPHYSYLNGAEKHLAMHKSCTQVLIINNNNTDPPQLNGS